MTDHELKITAFEVIFEHLLEEAEDEKPEKPKSSGNKATAKRAPARKAK